MAGLSAEGLTIKSLTDTITDMSDKIKARINPLRRIYKLQRMRGLSLRCF